MEMEILMKTIQGRSPAAKPCTTNHTSKFLPASFFLFSFLQPFIFCPTIPASPLSNLSFSTCTVNSCLPHFFFIFLPLFIVFHFLTYNTCISSLQSQFFHLWAFLLHYPLLFPSFSLLLYTCNMGLAMPILGTNVIFTMKSFTYVFLSFLS